MLLKNKYVKKLNTKLKARKIYKDGIKSGENSETVLFWTTGGMIIQTNLEAVIAVSLKLRGQNVRMVLCDGVYTACAKRVDMPDVPVKDWEKYCKSCIRQNSNLLDKLGIEYTYTSELITEEKSAELKKIAEGTTFENYKELTYNKIEQGSHLESAMMRHTRGGSYKGLEEILKEYAFTILVVAETSQNAVNKYNPSRVYMSHGIYADWGPALSVALEEKIPTTSYICCYLTGHFFFGTVNNFKETFLSISNNTWQDFIKKEFTEEQMNKLQNFISRRYLSDDSADLKGLLKEYKGDKEIFLKKYNLNSEKPVWGIMTHINWDAVSDYFPMIHKSFDDWLYETIKEIYNITDIQWLIKIHPSELNDNPLTGCQKFIEKNFPDLPEHIKVIKMDDDISPQDFYGLLDGGVTVMGTGGLELSMQGKPVILAGEAHYSDKGFTYDAKSEEHYKKLLREAKDIRGLNEEMYSLALKYGYIYFILKQIPLIPNVKEDLQIDFDKLDLLLPGKNKFMDFICDRILDRGDFVLPEELVSLTHVSEKDQIRKFA